MATNFNTLIDDVKTDAEVEANNNDTFGVELQPAFAPRHAPKKPLNNFSLREKMEPYSANGIIVQ